ncbi:hypothetical protein [Microbacterium atlanticum]|uniref:hypothetical protein n=1 Tax=Microbacterium atlanticum TaxID=2782168 RepID=UPI001886FEEB|nr:hypothetical protein [Microbacterium atlanticum]
MPRVPRPLPPELGDAFAYADARRAGVTRRRLRAQDCEAPFRGVRLLTRPDRIEEAADAPLARDRIQRADVTRRARGLQQVMPAHAFFATETAAVLWGVPVSHGDLLAVAVPAPHRAPRRQGVRGLQVDPGLVRVSDCGGVRVSSPASTWAMLGSILTLRELVTAGDAFVRIPRDDREKPLPHRSLTSIEQLQRATAAGPRKGAARLRAALELIRVGSSSPLESEYRLDAAGAGLPEPQLDVEIRDAAGRLLGISEVVYPHQRTVVEIEGDHHRTSRAQWNRDIEKYASYAQAGWEVVRLTSAHIRGRHPRAISIVRATLLRRGWEPS